MTKRFHLSTSDGMTLEARWDSPGSETGGDPTGRAVVLCHPHPLSGGTMKAPLMVAVTSSLVERGYAVLRFNFRGTGGSTGTHDNGVAERLDIEAAVGTAAEGRDWVGVAGWSFGAAIALSWLADTESGLPYVGIAPPAESLPSQVPTGPKRLIVGTRDQVVDVDALVGYARDHSIDLVLTPGDHFFHGRGRKIGTLVVQGFEI